jgi:hypothetical protein
MRNLRGRLTYANVMATIAVFIALGGASYAATQKLPKNSVGTKQLKKNAVTGAKVKNGTLTGTQINASTLGTVPNAAQAGNTQTVQGLTPVQIAATSRLRCPDGMVLASGLCFEPTARPAAEWLTAVFNCAHAGLRLPAQTELIAFEVQAYSSAPPLEWVGEVGGTLLSAAPFSIAVGSKSILSGEAPYRCVVNPSN